MDSASATNRLGVVLSSIENGPTASMSRAITGSDARRCATASPGSNPYAPSPSNKRRRRGDGPALNRQQAQFRRDAAAGGKASHAPACGKHTMTGHDDQERVSAQRLADGASQTARAEAIGDVAVRRRLAWPDRPRDLVDAPVEIGHRGHVEREGGQVVGRPGQNSGDGLRGADRSRPAATSRRRPDGAALHARACRPRGPRAAARRGCRRAPR